MVAEGKRIENHRKSGEKRFEFTSNVTKDQMGINSNWTSDFVQFAFFIHKGESINWDWKCGECKSKDRN